MVRYLIVIVTDYSHGAEPRNTSIDTALTGERFIDLELHGSVQRLYRTGDLGRRTNGGSLGYVDPADDQIKLRGFRIEPVEIEAALGTHPLVSESLVVTDSKGCGGVRLVAYWLPDTELTSGDIDAARLREHVRRQLPDYMIPAAFNQDRCMAGDCERQIRPAPFTASRAQGTSGAVPTF